MIKKHLEEKSNFCIGSTWLLFADRLLTTIVQFVNAPQIYTGNTV